MGVKRDRALHSAFHHSLSDMTETEDLAEAGQSREVRGHMYGSEGRELQAGVVSDHDLGLEDRNKTLLNHFKVFPLWTNSIKINNY